MRVAIVEDNESSKNLLLSYLKRYETENKTHIQTETFSDGIYFAEKYAYDTTFDVVLLDIEMEQLDGMKTAELIRSKDENVVIIFITNMAQFVMEGYKVRALDFVIKPVSYYMFAEKLHKAETRIAMREDRCIVIKTKESIFKVYTKEIIYIEIQNHSMIYHTINGDYACTGSLKKTEQELTGLPFARCSSSFLIHLPHIVTVHGDKVIMDNQDELLISRLKKQEFMETLTNYYGVGK